MKVEGIVIGVSAGGFKALDRLICGLKFNVLPPIIIVQHISPSAENYIVKYLNEKTDIMVKEVEEKEIALYGCAYFAPPNYHVLIERNRSFSLSTEKRVCYARPSIDVLFETAAKSYLDTLLAVVLTGANNDGTKGCEFVKRYGGTVIVQDPNEAEFDDMPRAVVESGNMDYIMTIEEIADFMNELVDDSVFKNK